MRATCLCCCRTLKRGRLFVMCDTSTVVVQAVFMLSSPSSTQFPAQSSASLTLGLLPPYPRRIIPSIPTKRAVWYGISSVGYVIRCPGE